MEDGWMGGLYYSWLKVKEKAKSKNEINGKKLNNVILLKTVPVTSVSSCNVYLTSMEGLMWQWDQSLQTGFKRV